MEYLLLVYHDFAAMERLSVDEKRALHRDSPGAADAPGVVAHYRLRRSEQVTTVHVENGRTAITTRLPAEQQPALRAVLICETEGPDAAVELALTLPAIRLGGAVEIWPLVCSAHGGSQTLHGRSLHFDEHQEP